MSARRPRQKQLRAWLRVLALCLAAVSLSSIGVTLLGACGVANLGKETDDDGSDDDDSDADADETALPKGAQPVPPSAAALGLDLPDVPPLVPSGAGQPVASFAPLAAAAKPAVATVHALNVTKDGAGRRRVVAEGWGTAFVYDPRGLLLTNNHVIEDASEITVRFAGGEEAVAEIVGRDPPTDIAVMRVKQGGLQALPLGDSDALLVGDWVLAIGNPFGLEHTVSAGILSAKGRTRDDVKGLDRDGYFDFLQTDASINPGNSGGPLLDLNGRVVGVNTAVRMGANNIGFAIPINMVKQLLPRLIADGEIKRSALGVEVKWLTRVDADRLKRDDTKGAWVIRVQPGGPADKAGIAPDDVILGFDGMAIEDPNDLRWQASIRGVDEEATLRVAREGRIFDLKVTLGALPE